MNRLTFFILFCFSFLYGFADSFYYCNGEKILLKSDNREMKFGFLDFSEDESKSYESKILNSAELITQNNSKKNFKAVKTVPCYKFTDNVSISESPFIFVKLRCSSDYAVLYDYCRKNGLIILRENKYLKNWYTVFLPSTCKKGSVEMANQAYESGLFMCAEPDFYYISEDLSVDPLYSEQWSYNNPYYAFASISAPLAWKFSTGKNIKVAIIENGIEITHEDLKNNCPVGYSYNTYTGTSPCNTIGDHGTHCAGIIAAVKDNGKGICGVAPDSKLMTISIPYGNQTLVTEYFANGIMWAANHDADIISCSQALAPSQLMYAAINYAHDNGRDGLGCLIVAAAGNSESEGVVFPASDFRTLAIGNLTCDNVIHPSSSYGKELDMCAPGTDIVSTISGNRYGYMTGTSMAAPCVAGIAALVLSKYPDLNISELKYVLRTSCKKVGNVEYLSTNGYEDTWHIKYGYGMIDAKMALDNEYLLNR